MGSWRKVGAFLGLVPDDQQHDDFGPDGDGADHGYAPRYDNEYDAPARDHAGFEGPGYDDGHDDRVASRPIGRGDLHARSEQHPRSEQQHPRSEQRGGRSYEPVVHGSLAVKPDSLRRESDLAGRPATVKLTGFGEARVIGEKYRDGQSVILDMTDMSDADARRLVDFSAGLAFSLRGSIEKVAPKVFMLLPADSDVSALTAAASMGR